MPVSDKAASSSFCIGVDRLGCGCMIDGRSVTISVSTGMALDEVV